MSHSPGPWKVKEDFILSANDEKIFQIVAQENWYWDKRLALAGPEMFAALHRCVSALVANGAPNCEAVKEARAAIHKITKAELLRNPAINCNLVGCEICGNPD